MPKVVSRAVYLYFFPSIDVFLFFFLMKVSVLNSLSAKPCHHRGPLQVVWFSDGVGDHSPPNIINVVDNALGGGDVVPAIKKDERKSYEDNILTSILESIPFLYGQDIHASMLQVLRLASVILICTLVFIGVIFAGIILPPGRTKALPPPLAES